VSPVFIVLVGSVMGCCFIGGVWDDQFLLKRMKFDDERELLNNAVTRRSILVVLIVYSNEDNTTECRILRLLMTEQLPMNKKTNRNEGKCL
jgi:hypothetical protein